MPRYIDPNNKDCIFEFASLPKMKANMLPTNAKCCFARLRQLSKRRIYTITQDWKLELKNYELVCIPENQRNNFIITVPKGFRFDGASVPWPVNVLSLGVLRPMGILFTASIIHDYAYRNGAVWIETTERDEPTQCEISRKEADRLFKDTIRIVNNAPVIAWLAWLGVRIGGYCRC